MTAILGISGFYHDSAAALVVDGEVVGAIQEERFSRKKHDAGFPGRAIEACLQIGGYALEDLDAVVYYEQPLLTYLHPSQFALIEHSTGFPFPKGFDRK